MLKTDLQKKMAIFLGVFFLLICILLIVFKVVTIYVLWAILFILPIIFAADICFVILPITIPLFFVMAGYTLITKKYEKYNSLYEIILVMIIVGIVNCEIDNMLNIKNYVMQTQGLRIYWMAYFGLALIGGCVFISKKKDARLYLITFGFMLAFYLLYKLVESFE